jgi:hypothetical protein
MPASLHVILRRSARGDLVDAETGAAGERRLSWIVGRGDTATGLLPALLVRPQQSTAEIGNAYRSVPLPPILPLLAVGLAVVQGWGPVAIVREAVDSGAPLLLAIDG